MTSAGLNIHVEPRPPSGRAEQGWPQCSAWPSWFSSSATSPKFWGNYVSNYVVQNQNYVHNFKKVEHSDSKVGSWNFFALCQSKFRRYLSTTITLIRSYTEKVSPTGLKFWESSSDAIKCLPSLRLPCADSGGHELARTTVIWERGCATVFVKFER